MIINQVLGILIPPILADQIRFDMDKGNYTGMVMIDLQKAFDTVDHDILLNKLKAIGLDDLSTSWFSSYLKKWFQKTEVDGIFSDPILVPCGVPQGSILGPLHLIDVNDMEAAVSCRLILYADDSALLVSGTSVSVIEKTLGHELTFLSEWLVDNKLSIHLAHLATSLILCHFDYACSAWFEGLQVNLQKKLQILQNKTMRFVLGYPPRSHIGIEEFTLLHWIPVCQRVKQIKLNNMYRIVHGNAPQ